MSHVGPTGMIIQTILVIHDRSQLSICFLFAFFSSKLNRFHVINNIRKIMLSKLDRFYGFLGYFLAISMHVRPVD